MSNNFTQTYADGAALTAAEITTAIQTATLDIANTTQMTTGTTSGTFLQSNGSGLAASFAAVPDPIGPSAIRNYGLRATAASGILKISLKSNALTDPSATDIVDIPFSSNGSTSGTYTKLQVAAALSISMPVGSTLSYGTSTAKVAVYAINVAGTVRLGVSASTGFDTGNLQTVTAISGAATSGTAIYSTATTGTYQVRLLGNITTAHNSSGNWQTPSAVNVFNEASLADPGTIGQIVPNWGAGISNTIVNGYTRSTGTGTTTLGVRSVALSTACSLFTNASTTFSPVTNLTVSLTTGGRPVMIFLQSTDTTNTNADGGFISVAGTTSGAGAGTYSSLILIKRNGTVIAKQELSSTKPATGATYDQFFPPSVITFCDTPSSGTNTYTIEANTRVGATGTVTFNKVQLVAYEL